MKEQLIHILDQSVCLSRKQMKEYLSGTMQREEIHAAEVHLSSCPLCNMAMEGFESHSEASLEAIAALNSGFLKDHFDNIAPQIHLNSMAPAAAMPTSARAARKHISLQPVWRNASIAAGILVLFGILWYVEFGRNDIGSSQSIARQQQSPPFQSPVGGPQKDLASAAGMSNGEADPNVPATAPVEDPSATELSSAAMPDVASTGFGGTPASVPKMNPAALTTLPSIPQESVAMISEASVKAIEKKAARVNTPLVIDKADGGKNPAQHPVREEKQNIREAVDIGSQSTYIPKGDVIIGGGRNTSHIALGNDAYDKGKYSAALVHYKKQITTGTMQDRSQARIYAARCYLALGKNAKAEELLNIVLQEGSGPERREARRMLRDLR